MGDLVAALDPRRRGSEEQEWSPHVPAHTHTASLLTPLCTPRLLCIFLLRKPHCPALEQTLSPRDLEKVF